MKTPEELNWKNERSRNVTISIISIDIDFNLVAVFLLCFIMPFRVATYGDEFSWHLCAWNLFCNGTYWRIIRVFFAVFCVLQNASEWIRTHGDDERILSRSNESEQIFLVLWWSFLEILCFACPSRTNVYLGYRVNNKRTKKMYTESLECLNIGINFNCF